MKKKTTRETKPLRAKVEIKSESIPVSQINTAQLKPKVSFWMKMGGVLGFFMKHLNKIILPVVAIAGIISVFAVFGVDEVVNVQSSFFRSLRMPFEKLGVSSFVFDLPSYFFVNLIILVIIFACCILLRPKRTVTIEPKKINRTVMFFSSVAVMYFVLVGIFLNNTAFLFQMILFGVLLAMLGMYFYKIDAKNGKKIFGSSVISKDEIVKLGIMAAAMVAIYVFDAGSWKYSFIGDEYAFYEYGKGLVNGSGQLRMLYENGVYSYHPIMSSMWHAFFMRVFGLFFGWKLSSAIVPALTIIPLYVWVKRSFNKTVAILAVASFAFAPAIMGFGHIGYNNIQAVFLFVTALMALELAISGNSAFWTFVAAAALGLGGYTFYTARLTVIVAAFYWFFHNNRKKYSWKNLVSGIGIYLGVISFVFLNPDFMHHMFMNSVVSGSEISNPNSRSIYMLLNYVHSFFSFIYRKTMSHYIPGRIADILTAIGIIAGMTWGLISFKRDWRARFLLVSYAVLVFFVGAIVQYNNPPNTRLYFLMPLLCVIGAVGLSRLLAVVSKFKHAYKKYKAARLFTACALVVICLLNFFLYFPKVFQFTPEALIARYALNEGKKKNIVVVTDKYFMISQVAALYKFDGRLERISAADIQTRVESDYMRNKVMILGDDLIGVRQGLRAYLKPGTVIMDGMGRESAYIFDFTDDQYYRGFVDLWKTNAAFVLGAQPTQGQEFNKPAAYSAPAVQAPTKPEIKPVTFSTAGGPCKTKQIPPFVPMTNAKFTFIKMYDVGAVTPSDIAVVPDGSRIFIVDGEGYKLFIYNRAGNTYKVYKKLSLSSKKGLLGMVDDRKQEQKEHAYIQYDASNNCLYILDGGKDTIKKYDLEGNFIKIITTSPFLHGARSMRLSHDGVFAISLTGRNMIQFTDVNGADRGNYYTPYGNNCGQLNQPCFVGFDSNLNRYVVDTLNSRVQVFSTAMKYMGNYGIGMSSTILGPQIVINEKVPLPYMAVTMQYTRSVLFIPLGKGTPKTLELKGESDISFTGPSPIAQDANGDIYIVDSRTKVLVKVTIPQNPMQ